MLLSIVSSALMLSHLSSAAPATASSAGTTASRFQYYEMPAPLSGPCDLCTGPDGAIWGEDILVNKILRIDPATSEVTTYDIPYTLPPISNRTAFGCVAQPGADGKVYAASGIRNQFVQIDPVSKAVKVFTPEPPIIGNLQPLNDFWTADDGMYFTQTTANLLTFFDYQTEKFSYFPFPTPASMPIGLRTAPDGSMWIVEGAAAKIARFDTVAKKFTNEYDTPLGTLLPSVMRALTDDEYLWFTVTLSNALGRISTKTGQVDIITNPTPLTVPIEDTNDPNGNVWYSSGTQNTLIYYKPSDGTFHTIQQGDAIIYTPLSLPPALDIAIHYGPLNSIWFAEVINNRVGRYQLTGDE